MKVQDDVVKFMRAAGQEIPTHPTIPTLDVRLLRAKLIFEEALEQCAAIGVAVVLNDTHDALIEDNVLFMDGGEPDLVEIADSTSDQLYVSLGTAAAFGINVHRAWEHVQASNMAKFGPGSVTRPDGKVLKPPGWLPPTEDIRVDLKEQSQYGNKL